MARCQDVIDTATENLASLAEHGVTQAKLTTAKQKLKAYDTVRGLPQRRDSLQPRYRKWNVS